MKKITPQDTITQLFKIGDKEKGFKASRKKGHVINRGPEIKITANFPLEMVII